LDMMRWMNDSSINKRKADQMSVEELEGKIIVGEFVNEPQPEFSNELYHLIEEKYGQKSQAAKSAYRED